MNIEDFNFENHFHSVYYWSCDYCGEDIRSDNDEMFEHFNECLQRTRDIKK